MMTQNIDKVEVPEGEHFDALIPKSPERINSYLATPVWHFPHSTLSLANSALTTRA